MTEEQLKRANELANSIKIRQRMLEDISREGYNIDCMICGYYLSSDISKEQRKILTEKTKAMIALELNKLKKELKEL